MTDPSTTHEKLRFRVSDTPPDIDDMVVYASMTTDLFGTSVSCNIIGSSHHIAAPELDYYETSSCKSMVTDVLDVVELSTQTETTFSVTVGELDAEIRVVSRPLATFTPTATYDLFYRFEEDAYTAINITDTGYETYHTYPEYDLNLYTHTAVEGY